jgi:hypothetical protein
MAVKFTREQIRYIRDSFQEILTDEERDSLKCTLCKWSVKIALGAVIAAAIASGDLDDDVELIDALAFFADISTELAKQWLEEAASEGLDGVSKIVAFLCVKMKACK